jgi:hypothetical protein
MIYILFKFFMDRELDERADPRHTRKMSIRDPPYIREAKMKRQARFTGSGKKWEKEGAYYRGKLYHSQCIIRIPQNALFGVYIIDLL